MRSRAADAAHNDHEGVRRIDGSASNEARMATPPRVVAFHLPQFHPVAENDEWWGKGFTEWTNVAKAKPLFRGHHQPKIPTDLGFYDLRISEVRHQQADLARQYGVTAFCYWHYWFGGRRLLERPVEEILTSGEPNHPFALAWANQTWTGIWHGAPGRILVEQTYPGKEDDQAHFQVLLRAFTDPRYLKVGGRPLFYVFRPEQLPDAAAWTARWQAMARAEGLPGLYLVAEVSDLLGAGPVFTDVRSEGFDAGAYVRIPAARDTRSMLGMRARRKLRGGPEVYRHARDLPKPPLELADERLHPCVYPNWDNTPRSGRRGVVLSQSTPDVFRRHVSQAVARALPGEEALLFVKSWNEWAEGNHLEPDDAVGHGWLQALKDGLR